MTPGAFFKQAGAALVALCVLAACQTAPKQRESELQTVPPNHQQQLSAELERSLEKKLQPWNDQVVEKFVSELANRLVAGDAAYKKAVRPLKVTLLRTDGPYAAPGLAGQIFLSRGMVQAVQYENELAFVVATQLALLRDGATSRNLAALQGHDAGENLITAPAAPPLHQQDYLERDWFEPGGLFDFGSDAYLRAEADAVRLIYGAHYDPRGAVSFIQNWNGMPRSVTSTSLGKILPEAAERLRSAREEVAKLSPLRDPIVRTQAFEAIQARVKSSNR